MDDHKIEKGLRRASFQLSNGDWIEGDIFLSLYDAHRLGAQKMDGLLSSEHRFIPVKTGGGLVLLNVSHILQGKIDSQKEEDELMRLGVKHTVCIKTVLGEEVRGEICINLPPGRNRVKDYANATDGFFRLFQEGYILYVNPRHILSIHD